MSVNVTANLNIGWLMTKVGLVQINSSFSGQNYLPLSVGMLQAYAQRNLKDPDGYEWLLPIYCRLRVSEALERLSGADIVLFSVYVWNFQLSLAIARGLDCKVVFGGPHVTEDLREKYPFIDAVCIGEGELSALHILEENRYDANWVKSDRNINLDLYLSPYLEDTFAPLMDANPDEEWVALWETNRGCPFSCTFCDWGSAVAAKVYKFDMERLKREVDWFAAHKIEYIYCCDANFGMLPRDLELVEYVAEVKKQTGYPHKLSVQNTKNSTERSYAVQKLLSDHGLNQGVTVSMQSLDKHTLEAVKRSNISTESFRSIQERFNEDGVATYTDLILGLPGETYESFIAGVVNTIESGQRNRIQFNNLSILPNAEMGNKAYQEKYGMITVEANIINGHGSLIGDEVVERQLLVVGTDAMPKEDWVKARAMSWMISLVYFDKLLILPLTLLHDKYGVDYRTLFQKLAAPGTGVLGNIFQSFEAKARDIQEGGEEFCESKEWLGIWWPADEYEFIKLTVERKITEFYAEVWSLLVCSLFDTPSDPEVGLAIFENKRRLKQPTGNLDTWLREVVWYGNKRGSYLND